MYALAKYQLEKRVSRVCERRLRLGCCLSLILVAGACQKEKEKEKVNGQARGGDISGHWRIEARSGNDDAEMTYWIVTQNGDAFEGALSCGANDAFRGRISQGTLVIEPAQPKGMTYDPQAKPGVFEGKGEVDGNKLYTSFVLKNAMGTTLVGTKLKQIICDKDVIDPIRGIAVPAVVTFSTAPMAQNARPAECDIDPPLKGPPTGMDHFEDSRGSALAGGKLDFGTKPEEKCLDASRGEAALASCGQQGGAAVDGYTFCGVSDYVARNGNEVVLLDRAMLADDEYIYPGSFLRGSELSAGRITSFDVRRSEGRFYVDGLSLPPGTTTSFQSRIDPADINDGANALVHKATDAAASYRERVVSFSSKEEFLLKNGGHFAYSGFELDAQVDASGTSSENFASLTATQGFYKIHFQPPVDVYDNFTSEDKVHGGKCFQDSSGYISKDSPLLYVSNVEYGRQVIVVARSRLDRARLEYLLHVGYNSSSVEVDAKFDGWDQKDVNESDINVLIRGGSSAQISKIDTSGTPQDIVERIAKVLRDERATTFSAATPVKPIAYTLRYLHDNATATMAFAIAGWQRSCRPIKGGVSEYQLEATDVNDDVAVFRVEPNGTWGDWDRNRIWSLDGPCPPGKCAYSLDPEFVNGAPFSVTVGNKGCFKSNATFSITRAGVLIWGPERFEWGGFNHCGYQVDIRLKLIGAGVIQKILWKRIP